MIRRLLSIVQRLLGKREPELNFSIVIFTKTLPTFSDGQVIDAIRRALPLNAPEILPPSGITPIPDFAPEPDNPGRTFAVAVNRCVYAIVVARFTYEPDPAANPGRSSRPDFDAAYRQHKGWIAIDLISGQAEEPYRIIGQLAAELIPPDATLLFLPGFNMGRDPDPDLLEAMRHGEWLSRFEQAPAGIIERAADDPALAAAAAEARQRFPEFAHAFQSRIGTGHSAKFPFRDGDAVEHMWIDVTNIQGQTISGTLGNPPAQITSLAIGQPVSCALDDLEDWLYILNNDIVGGFSIHVLIDEPQP